MNQEIIFEVGGTLTYDAQQGRPSSATASIRKPDGTEIATPTVTIDACNTNISGTAAAGVSTIDVDSATGIVAKRYFLLTDPYGSAEWVRIKAVDDTNITLYEPTSWAHTASSTLVGTRLSIPVTSGQATPLGEGYELRLTYTVDGALHYPIEQWDVVRSVWPSPLMAQWEFIRLAGDLGRDIAAHPEDVADDFADQIETATEAVKTEMLARGFHHAKFRSHTEFKPVVAWKIIQQWARRGENVPAAALAEGLGAWVEHVDIEYNKALTIALATARSFDEDQSGVVDESERARTLNVHRLSR